MSVSLLSIDLGSGSGRAIVASYNNEAFSLNEVHRFPNEIIKDNNKLYWNIDYLFSNVKLSIKKAFEFEPNIESIAIDTWGCDYAWIDKNGDMLANPRSYKEEIDKSIIDKVHSIIPLDDLYQINGNAYFNFNSIYQIYKDIHIDKVIESGAAKFLFMPNLFFYLLTGEYTWEYTISSTSGLMDTRKRDWSTAIFEKLSLPENIKGGIVMPGEKKCPLKKEIFDEMGLKGNIPFVVSVAGHDTASAVVGLNITSNKAYLLNGSWSLFGIEVDEPVTDKHGVKRALVNEGSFNSSIRYMKMFLGTWLLRAIKEDYERLGQKYSYDDICEYAKKSSENAFVDIDDEFIYPDSMILLFKDRYRKKYNKEILSTEDICRLAYNSLGNLYRLAVTDIESTSNTKIDSIIVGGGGTKDDLLLQIIADSTERKIEIGITEASVLGNAIVQLYALGYTNDITNVSRVIVD